MPLYTSSPARSGMLPTPSPRRYPDTPDRSKPEQTTESLRSARMFWALLLTLGAVCVLAVLHLTWGDATQTSQPSTDTLAGKLARAGVSGRESALAWAGSDAAMTSAAMPRDDSVATRPPADSDGVDGNAAGSDTTQQPRPQARAAGRLCATEACMRGEDGPYDPAKQRPPQEVHAGDDVELEQAKPANKNKAEPKKQSSRKEAQPQGQKQRDEKEASARQKRRADREAQQARQAKQRAQQAKWLAKRKAEQTSVQEGAKLEQVDDAKAQPEKRAAQADADSEQTKPTPPSPKPRQTAAPTKRASKPVAKKQSPQPAPDTRGAKQPGRSGKEAAAANVQRRPGAVDPDSAEWPNTVALCTMMRNEHPDDVLEWLQYHRCGPLHASVLAPACAAPSCALARHLRTEAARSKRRRHDQHAR